MLDTHTHTNLLLIFLVLLDSSLSLCFLPSTGLDSLLFSNLQSTNDISVSVGITHKYLSSRTIYILQLLLM